MSQLTDNVRKKLEDAGLTVRGPRGHGETGWFGRYTICRGLEVQYDISVLLPPILWLWIENDNWTVARHTYVPGPGPGYFYHNHDSLESACDEIVAYYLENQSQ